MTIVFAMLLDAIFGEPKALWNRVPHPAVLMGKCVDLIDEEFNRGNFKKAKGIVAFGGLVIAFGLLGVLITMLPTNIPEIIIGAILIAHKSLIDHVNAVADALGRSVAEGRKAVSMIVGRDTSEMDEPAVSRAAIESAAENFSDGIIAPVFWFVILGLPGLLIYKITNTADSMIGYRTSRHQEFGWAAARFDDVLNWAPARLTAGLFWCLNPRNIDLPSIKRDAALHRSPNAGWPEAAMSRLLGVALAGPRAYHGTLKDFPWVNASGRTDATALDIRASTGILWQAWVIALGVVTLIAYL